MLSTFTFISITDKFHSLMEKLTLLVLLVVLFLLYKMELCFLRHIEGHDTMEAVNTSVKINVFIIVCNQNMKLHIDQNIALKRQLVLTETLIKTMFIWASKEEFKFIDLQKELVMQKSQLE